MDTSFAIRGWRSMDSVSAAEFIDAEVTRWMGAVSLTDRNRGATTVDKSFGYKRDAKGVLRPLQP